MGNECRPCISSVFLDFSAEHTPIHWSQPLVCERSLEHQLTIHEEKGAINNHAHRTMFRFLQFLQCSTTHSQGAMPRANVAGLGHSRRSNFSDLRG